MGNGVLHVYYKYDVCKCNVNPIRSQLEHGMVKLIDLNFFLLLRFIHKLNSTIHLRQCCLHTVLDFEASFCFGVF